MFLLLSLLVAAPPSRADVCAPATIGNITLTRSNGFCENCFILRAFADCRSCRNYTADSNDSYNLYCYTAGTEAERGIDLALCNYQCNDTGFTPFPTPPDLVTGTALCPGRNNSAACNVVTEQYCSLFNNVRPTCRYCPHETPCPTCVAFNDVCYAPDPSKVGATIVDPNAGAPYATSGSIAYAGPPTLTNNGGGAGVPLTSRSITTAGSASTNRAGGSVAVWFGALLLQLCYVPLQMAETIANFAPVVMVFAVVMFVGFPIRLLSIVAEWFTFVTGIFGLLACSAFDLTSE